MSDTIHLTSTTEQANHLYAYLHSVDGCPGYADLGEYWRSRYEQVDLAEECARLWTQVKPLYQQLHAYVRRRLLLHYRGHAQHFPASGHIPAHLLGDYLYALLS